MDFFKKILVYKKNRFQQHSYPKSKKKTKKIMEMQDSMHPFFITDGCRTRT